MMFLFFFAPVSLIRFGAFDMSMAFVSTLAEKQGMLYLRLIFYRMRMQQNVSQTLVCFERYSTINIFMTISSHHVFSFFE